MTEPAKCPQCDRPVKIIKFEDCGIRLWDESRGCYVGDRLGDDVTWSCCYCGYSFDLEWLDEHEVGGEE